MYIYLYRFPISNIWTSESDANLQIKSEARYLLIIEKEGVFRRMCEDGFTSFFRCILVTGCGYPDVATRALVHRVSTALPYLIVLGICDYNPHGIALLLTYKFGAKNTALEAAGLETHRLKAVTKSHLSVS